VRAAWKRRLQKGDELWTQVLVYEETHHSYGSGASTRIAGADDLRAALRELRDPIPEPFAREFQSGTVYRPVSDGFFHRIIEESLTIPPRLWPVMIDCPGASALRTAAGDTNRARLSRARGLAGREHVDSGR